MIFNDPLLLELTIKRVPVLAVLKSLVTGPPGAINDDFDDCSFGCRSCLMHCPLMLQCEATGVFGESNSCPTRGIGAEKIWGRPNPSYCIQRVVHTTIV